MSFPRALKIAPAAWQFQQKAVTEVLHTLGFHGLRIHLDGVPKAPCEISKKLDPFPESRAARLRVLSIKSNDVSNLSHFPSC